MILDDLEVEQSLRAHVARVFGPKRTKKSKDNRRTLSVSTVNDNRQTWYKKRKARGEEDLILFNGKVVKKRGVSIEFGQLSCFYVNARNLMNKLDLFKAWVQGAQT